MESPPGCSSSSADETGNRDHDIEMNVTPVRPVGDNQLNQSCDADISVDGQTPKNKKRRKKKPSQNDGKRRRRPYHKNGATNINLDDAVPSPQIPVSRIEKKAYRKECISRPILTAPCNTGSFICENNQLEEEDDPHDLEHDFNADYHSRLNDEYQGEKERTSHEENINKRHDYLRQRLDIANQEIERIRPFEDEVVKLRLRVSDLEGEVMKLRSINRSIARSRTQSESNEDRFESLR